MFRVSNRKAISVVMTVLIILVASVVLGTSVVLYGTSLFQTGGQTQSIAVQGLKVWVNSTCTGTQVAGSCPANTVEWGAAAIRNNGDVLVSVSSIQIRGVQVPYTNWYVDTNSSQVSANFQAQFISSGTTWAGMMHQNAAYANANTCPAQVMTAGIPNEITINELGTPDQIGQPYSVTMLCLNQASGPTALTPGSQMIIYFNIPNNVLSPVDSGSSVTVTIAAGNVGSPQTVTVANS